MIHRSERSLFLTGFLATLSGVGLARFAYTALMPQMVLAGWFTGEQVAYLGAANLLGYLVGALAAAPLAERVGGVRALVLCWAAVVVSFLGCSFAQPMAVFFFWRLLSGIAGAALMVLGPSLAMAATPWQRRAALGPLMFCGIGVGALLSATLVPSLAQQSLAAVWLGLAGVSLAALWWGWRSARSLPAPAPVAATPSAGAGPAASAATAPVVALWTLPVVLVFVAYTTDAFGFVPHTVFWVDYLARELQLGAAYGSTQWAIFGLGAVAGPLFVSFCASRWGWWQTAVAAYIFKTASVGLPLIWSDFYGHALSGFFVGALTPGVTAITSGYLLLLLGSKNHKRIWGYATATFALAQATAGICMAAIYSTFGSYLELFLLGFIALLVGSVVIAFSKSR